MLVASSSELGVELVPSVVMGLLGGFDGLSETLDLGAEGIIFIAEPDDNLFLLLVEASLLIEPVGGVLVGLSGDVQGLAETLDFGAEGIIFLVEPDDNLFLLLVEASLLVEPGLVVVVGLPGEFESLAKTIDVRAEGLSRADRRLFAFAECSPKLLELRERALLLDAQTTSLLLRGLYIMAGLLKLLAERVRIGPCRDEILIT